MIMRANRAFVYRLFILPIVVILLSALGAIWFSASISLSFLLGGVAWLVPNLFFAHKAFPKKLTRFSAMSYMWAFYRAEIIKLILSVLLMLVAAKYLTTNIIVLLVGYLLAQITFLFAAMHNAESHKGE